MSKQQRIAALMNKSDDQLVELICNQPDVLDKMIDVVLRDQEEMDRYEPERWDGLG